jgi:hypothetical protein
VPSDAAERTPEVALTRPSPKPPKVMVPSASKLELPISILPKPEEIAPELRVPTAVRDEVVTPEPRVVALKT